jgi:hypothetical protein
MNYLELVARDEEKRIAIDFDGVIHDDYLGFHDGTIYGEKYAGVDNALKTIFDMGFEIVIFTAKAKADRPLVNNKTGIELVWEWLELQELSQYIIAVTAEKPRAKVYIDDKAYRHTNWVETMEFLIALKNEI